MKRSLSRWGATYHAIIWNAGSMVTTTAATSALGFVYWWLAAREFPPEAVGLAAAAISAMMLLSTISVMGLSTVLIGELPRNSDEAASLITSALLIVGVTGAILGVLFAATALWMAPDLEALSDNIGSVTLFAVGVSLTTMGVVTDQALIGLLRGELQLWRNIVFSAVKLGALFLAGRWLANHMGLTIYGTWALGNLLSLVTLLGFAIRKRVRLADCCPHLRMVRRLGNAGLVHHAFNLTLLAPGMILPVLVTAVLSARMNAYFYTAWMIASLAFMGSIALTTVLYATSAADPDLLTQKLRATLKLSLVIGLVASVALLVGADFILRLFGGHYAEQAGWSLRVLTLGVFPLVIKNHYTAVCRVRDRVGRAVPLMLLAAILELLLALAGAITYGLLGLALGWVIAVWVEAIFMVRTVYRVAAPVSGGSAARNWSASPPD